MSFGKLKTRLRALINRKDFSDELAGGFIQDAITDMERVLRLSVMENVLTQEDWDGTRNALITPDGFLEVINIFHDNGELEQVDLSTFLATRDQGGVPTVFVRMAGRWLLRPTPAPGTKIYFHHYRQSPTLLTDTDTNVWTRAAPNAVVYQSATLAADFYQMEDEYAQRFQTRADNYVQAIITQDDNEKWAGRLAVPLPSDIGDY
jgi:hypothetical protein